jgi:hypothetical protein
VLPITFSITWEKEPYIALERRYGRVGYNVRRLLGASVLFLIFFLSLVASASPSKWVMLAGLLFELSYLLYVWSVAPARQWRELYSTEKLSCSVDDRGITMGSNASRELSWGECRRIIRVHGAYLLKGMNHSIEVAIPTSAFSTPSEEAAFVAVASQHLNGLASNVSHRNAR